jgi:peptide/nickel transport system permease protein
MIQFLLKRVIQAAPVMFIISMFCFSIQDTLDNPTREFAAQSMAAAYR